MRWLWGIVVREFRVNNWAERNLLFVCNASVSSGLSAADESRSPTAAFEQRESRVGSSRVVVIVKVAWAELGKLAIRLISHSLVQPQWIATIHPTIPTPSEHAGTVGITTDWRAMTLVQPLQHLFNYSVRHFHNINIPRSPFDLISGVRVYAQYEISQTLTTPPPGEWYMPNLHLVPRVLANGVHDLHIPSV